MNLIKNKNFPEERALYGLRDTRIEHCSFKGEEDGESAFKEASNIEVSHCTFALRYPFWHTVGYYITDSTLEETCRAPLWYAREGRMERVTINGPKALRECDEFDLREVTARSAEFGWKCRDGYVKDCTLESEYIFFGAERLRMENVALKGKYSFQYVSDLHILNSELDTKDSFWHARNVLVENSTVRGEYLGWYSDGLTLKNCKIIGTQPFCYCTDLVLVNCELIDCDLAFEYSDVTADTHGHIISIKNPVSGRIVVDSVGEIIRDGAVYECDAEIVVR